MKIKNSNFLKLFAAALVGFMLIMAISYSCTHEPDGIADIPEICFENEVLPVFQNSCGLSEYHDAASAKEGYIFTDYNSITKIVKPGDPSSSPAYTSLSARGEDRMPPENVLPLQSRQTIRIWIENGYPNN